jgi:hypothetical protein
MDTCAHRPSCSRFTLHGANLSVQRFYVNTVDAVIVGVAAHEFPNTLSNVMLCKNLATFDGLCCRQAPL